VAAHAEFESEIDSDFDNFILKKNENLSDECLKNRFYLKPSLLNIKIPKKREERYDYDFFTRSLFSPSYVSPKRGLEGFWKRSIVDSIRQIMEEINKNSIERGRIIDFKDILYGYVRHHPLTGLDYIIDLLLIYRKYEGRKMTVPVRRHAYIRNSYTDMLFREDDLVSSIFIKGPKNRNGEPNQTNQDNSDNQSNTLIKQIANFILPINKNPRDAQKLEQNNSDFNLGIMKLNEIDKYFYADKLLTSKSVNFVLPLTGRWDIFKRFMANYENICLKTNENTRLVVVLFENDSNDKITDETLLKGEQKQSNLIKELFNNLKKKYPTNVNDKTMNLILNSSSFSRSIGCELGAASFDVHDLIFFIDVDIFFTNEFLLRARLNTIEYKQVYYPIVFSEYDPDDTQDAIRVMNNKMASSKRKSFLNNEDIFKESFTYDFDSDSGYWRQFGFGIVSVFNSDLRRVGGFDTSIIGWGKEDVDLFEKFIKSNLTLFRSVDPGLIHVFHKIDCDPNLSPEQMIMCMGSKATSIASQRVLAKLVYEKNAHLIEPVNSESKHSTVRPSDQKLK
jgi:chondroitin sulfate synthase